MEEATVTQDEVVEIQDNQETTPQETTTPTEKVEPEKTEKSIDVKTVLAQKEHFRTKAEEVQKKLDAVMSTLKDDKEVKEIQKEVATANPLEVVKLAKALEGYSEDETSYIMRNAKSTSINDIIDATKDEWVSQAITAKRAKVENDNKTPDSSSPSATVGGISADKIKDMSSAEYNKFLNEQVKARR